MATAKLKCPDAAAMRQRAEVFKALGHPSRLMMIESLAARGELCVCEHRTLVGADMSTVSRHLVILKKAGLVTDRREGTWIHYSLVAPAAQTLADDLASLAGQQA